MEKMFPLQSGYRDAKSAPHPLQIPWSVAEKAYCAYARRYGTRQSLERLAERGGFDGAEMDMLYPPWRDEVSELTTLRQRVEELEADAAKPWAYRLTTTPEPDAPGSTYPNIGEPYDLRVIDTGHSDRIIVLGSDDLDARILALRQRAEDAERRVRELEGAILAAEERGRWQEIKALMEYADERRIPLATADALLRRLNDGHAKAAIDAAGGEG